MIKLRDLITERRLTKAQAKDLANKKDWDSFVDYVKKNFPGKRATFYYDGGSLSAQIKVFGGHRIVGISGMWHGYD